MPEEKKPVSFVSYRKDRNNPSKKKAIIIPQEDWEREWLNWWTFLGTSPGTK